MTLGSRQCLSCVLIGFSILGAPSFGRAQNSVLSTNEAPVLMVNQQPVSAGEYQWFMQQERAAVFRLFKATPDQTNFWDQQFSGTSARALLRERTVKRIIESKVEQQLFSDLGLAKQFSYQTFLKDLEDYNHERELLAAKGGVVYGPVNYTQLQYYQHWMTELRMRATEKLAETKWDVSEEKIRDFFERNQEQFHHAEPTNSPEAVSATHAPSFKSVKNQARAQYLDSLYNELISDRVKRATVKSESSPLDTLVQ